MGDVETIRGGAPSRGTLLVFLGAAPGVGKTWSMLAHGQQRASRGDHVLIGYVQTHGRLGTMTQLQGLPGIGRRHLPTDPSDGEFDLAGVLARRPDVVLVDELAHKNPAGGDGNAHRWQDVQALLAAGIDVVSTIDVSELASLADVIEQLTGSVPRLLVPDAIVRAAEVELVDLAPEALMERLARGVIYPPELLDAELGNLFRPATLAGLREVALLWLADSVAEDLRAYQAGYGSTVQWETRERVVVGLSGGPEGEALVRRASRIASQMAGGELSALHVSPSGVPTQAGVAPLAGQRLLVESLGGTYHSVIGDDVPSALAAFAKSVGATQIVLGASRRRRSWLGLPVRGVDTLVSAISGGVDVHTVGPDLGTPDQSHVGHELPPLTGGLTRRRRLIGFVTAGFLLVVLTTICSLIRSRLSFAGDVPLFLLAVVITSLIGGIYPALFAAVAGSLLLNYFFTVPFHALTISEPANVVALIIFLLIAGLVSRVVDLAARRSTAAARAGAEAETLSTFAGSLLRGEQALPALMARVRETFAMGSVSLLQRSTSAGSGDHWVMVESLGEDPPSRPADADAQVEVDTDLALALRGGSLPADGLRILSAFAAHVAVAYRERQLAEAARAVEPLEEAERQRTALLNTVSHDLRTPIAAAKAAVSSLRDREISWDQKQQAELLATAEGALDRLTDLVTNLLDMSRLRAGALPVRLSPVGLEDIVAGALSHVAPGVRVDVAVADDLPEVIADAGLLERVVANLVQNALRHAPSGRPVRVSGSAYAGRVELRIIDRGPGVPADLRERMFEAFQRRDDSNASGPGVGLGLAIARGLTEAMGGSVTVEPTPGGGATFVVVLLPALEHGPGRPVDRVTGP